ncbi:hypothetical protein TETAUR1b_000011 [Candidatus Hodgkinia cicadicola]|nr:hypothetical protein TETAUR1b_000011 [Candidatus Hodgkinia cicadicola]
MPSVVSAGARRFWRLQNVLFVSTCGVLFICSRGTASQVCFGELHANSHLVVCLGLLIKGSVVGWVSCVFSAWSMISGLARLITPRMWRRFVCVCLATALMFASLVCLLLTLWTRASVTLLEHCWLHWLLAQPILVRNSFVNVQQLEKRFGLILGRVWQTLQQTRPFELAKLGLLKCASFVRLNKLGLLKAVVFRFKPGVRCISERAKAWLNLKRVRSKLLCWLDKSAKTESDSLFQFSLVTPQPKALNAIADVIMSSLVICSVSTTGRIGRGAAATFI